jgi:hypothetical protein
MQGVNGPGRLNRSTMAFEKGSVYVEYEEQLFISSLNGLGT